MPRDSPTAAEPPQRSLVKKTRPSDHWPSSASRYALYTIYGAQAKTNATSCWTSYVTSSCKAITCMSHATGMWQAAARQLCWC